jgi:hypothetical protein
MSMPQKPEEPFEVRDSRINNRYSVDNSFMRGGWAGKLGPYAIAVYDCLCLHADAHSQSSWPSYNTISRLTGMSRRQAIRIVPVLEKYRLIAIEQEYDPATNRMRNIYRLLDQSVWLPPDAFDDEEVGDSQSPVTHSHQIDDSQSPVTHSHQVGDSQSPPSDSQSPTPVTHSHPNNTHITIPMNNTQGTNTGAPAPGPDPPDGAPADLSQTVELEQPGNGAGVLSDPRAGDHLGLAQACAERQAEEGGAWTVPEAAGGADPRGSAMLDAWLEAKHVDPQAMPEALKTKWRRWLSASVERFNSLTPEDCALAVTYLLKSAAFGWYAYSSPAVQKFKDDVVAVALQILSGIDLQAELDGAPPGNANGGSHDETKGIAMVLRRQRERRAAEAASSGGGK